MQKYLNTILIILVIFLFTNCGKNGGTGSQPTPGADSKGGTGSQPT